MGSAAQGKFLVLRILWAYTLTHVQKFVAKLTPAAPCSKMRLRRMMALASVVTRRMTKIPMACLGLTTLLAAQSALVCSPTANFRKSTALTPLHGCWFSILSPGRFKASWAFARAFWLSDILYVLYVMDEAALLGI